MRILLAFVIALFCRPSEGKAEELQTDGWSTAVLWKSDVVSARLLFKPSASLADKHWLALEFENHTQKPLEFGQTWINLNMTRKAIPSGEVLTTGGLSGIFGSIKTLPPGRHRFYGDALESASANMGLPRVTGLRVEVQAKVDSEIRGGQRYQTAKYEPSFTFEWRYTSATEMVWMI